MSYQVALLSRGSKTEPARTDAPAIDETFPEQECNALARLESFNKHLFRPNTYLHKWWARRCGTTFRHILKQLVPDPEKRGYYEPGGLEGKVILDPMMGGGTTLHEAIRMGASAIGTDIDPIPVLQARATLSPSGLSRRERVFSELLKGLSLKLAPLFVTTCPICQRQSEVQFTLYALRKRCACGEALVLDDLTIRHDPRGNTQICPRCRQLYRAGNHVCGQATTQPLIAKGTRLCAQCRQPYAALPGLPFREWYAPLIVSGHCPAHRQFFRAVGDSDLGVLARARRPAEGLDLGDPQLLAVAAGPKSDALIARGVKSFADLFTPRQLLYLDAARRFVATAAEGDRIWLALLVSTSLEFNCLLCGYKGGHRRRPGAIRHVFSHHGYSFPYTALENNPIFSGNLSGTLRRIFCDRIVKAAQWAQCPAERCIGTKRDREVQVRGEVDSATIVRDWQALRKGPRRALLIQGDAGRVELPRGLADYAVTDPPYYDSVQYGDLSAFFRVWLRAMLPEDADWEYDRSGSAVCEGNASHRTSYRDSLTRIWRACAVALKPISGRLIFTFHHWKPEAWSDLTVSLREAGFVLANTYVVFSENPMSVHIRNLRAVKHDCILVLRPVSQGPDHVGARGWPEPHEVNMTDSEAFCRDCGRALWWFLSANMTEREIAAQWRRLLRAEHPS